MKNRLNNKGFTLVELLAVLVILIAITTGIAIPSISSSLERTKEKQNNARLEIIKSAAEMYITDHKNKVYNKLSNNSSNECYFSISSHLINYLSNEEKKDADGNAFDDFVIFNKESGYHIIKTEAPNNALLVDDTLSYIDENGVSKSINVPCE